MLHANELMVGDWYAFRGHPYQCTASDIASLAECEEKGTPTDIFEIPLTPEILEKNGFKKEGSWFIIEDDYYDVSIKEITDGLWRVKYCNTVFSVFDCVLHIVFIHQLQHVLRICGIEKEITL